MESPFVSKTTRLKPFQCNKCYEELDCVTSMGHAERPGAGHLSVCVNCGHVAIFDENLMLNDFVIDELRMQMQPKDYLIMKKAATFFAEKFHNKNGFYISTLFQEL